MKPERPDSLHPSVAHVTAAIKDADKARFELDLTVTKCTGCKTMKPKAPNEAKADESLSRAIYHLKAAHGLLMKRAKPQAK